MLALFLVAGSLAGSAGEAAYQLRLAIIAESKERAAAKAAAAVAAAVRLRRG